MYISRNSDVIKTSYETRTAIASLRDVDRTTRLIVRKMRKLAKSLDILRKALCNPTRGHFHQESSPFSTLLLYSYRT